MNAFEQPQAAQPIKLTSYGTGDMLPMVPPEAIPGAMEPAEGEASYTAGRWDQLRCFARRHKGKMLLGAAAVSLAMPFAINPVEEAGEQVGSAIGWTVAGGAVSESMFIGGIGIMGLAVGAQLGANPLKWKDRLDDVTAKADNSLLFKAGFWVNTTGAVGTAAIGTAAALTYLPPESMGILTIPAFDLWLTYAIRKAVLGKIKENVAKNATRPVAQSE